MELDHTSDPYTRLRPGARGTVLFLDSLGSIHVRWDQGATLGLIIGVDRWHYVADETRPATAEEGSA